MNGELPKGWVWTSLGEVCSITSGNPAPQGKDFFENGKYPFVRVHDMGQLGNNVYLHETKDYINEKATKKMKVFPKGSVLFTKSGMSLLLNQRAILGRDMYVVSHIGVLSSNNILSEWIYYWLKTKDFKELAHATTLPSLPLPKIIELEIPLPPLAEQQRIVNKIEELFTNLDKGVESLNEVKYKLKIYRQAILKYAMEGKLTEKWRAENKDKIEPASGLLENIKINNDYPFQYKPINHELPINWVYTRVGNILEVIRGASPRPKGDPKYFGGNIPWIMISDISREKGKFISKTKDTVNEEGAKKSRYLPKGTLILSNSGTVCIPKILSVDGCIHDGFVAFPNFSRYLNMLYFYYYFYYVRPDIIQENKQGVTQVNLNTTIIKNIVVSLPPLEEQNIIVERIEELFSLADYIEETVDSKLEQSKNLRQSILKKAFEGKLVPQDPNDEPAEILLEKIKKQRLNKEKLVQEKLV